MVDFILVIDAGTTGVQASLFETSKFQMFGNIKVEFKQYFPQPGYVEHDANEIWQATLEAIKKNLSYAQKHIKNFSVNKIVGIGITNQRETCLPWNKNTFDTPFRAIVWQDRRTADECIKYKKNESVSKKIRQITGLVCDPYFSATKMKWMLNNYKELKSWSAKKELAFGTIDSFLIWKLTDHQQHVTDHTNASRTMLYSLDTGDYSDELLKFFKIPHNALPKILPSAEEFGKTKGLKILPDGIPICAVLGDQQSALYGQHCTQKGNTKITFGTGAFILMNTGSKPIQSSKGLLTTVAFSQGARRTFALEGSTFIAGAAVQFLRDNFEWLKEAKESEALALKEPRDPNLLFIPAFVGLGAPYWNPNAKAVLLGMNRGTQKSQIMRAVLESIALQNVNLLKLISAASRLSITKLKVDGGASANDYLMQFQSDILQKILYKPQNLQTTSLGVAFAAYEYIAKKKISIQDKETVFKPKMHTIDAKKILTQWQKAVEFTNTFYQGKN